MEIEVDLALKRLADNKALYVHLALGFPRDAAAMTSQVKSLLAAGEQGAAAGILHNLKGVASTVGARALAEEVTALEHQLRSAAPAEGEARCRALEACVAEAQRALEKAIAALRPASPAQSEVHELHTLLTELAPLLASGNMRALSVFARVQYRFGALSSLQSSPHMAALADAMHALDFRRALDNCHQLAGELERP